MSTKSAPWAKWPSQWLKRLPNTALEPMDAILSTLEIGTPVNSKGRPQGPSERGAGAVFRFEDFVERPLRSISQRHADVSRGRLTGETDGDCGGDDGSGALGAQP